MGRWKVIGEFLEANAVFDKICRDRNVECPAPRTTARLIDKVRDDQRDCRRDGILPLVEGKAFILRIFTIRSDFIKGIFNTDFHGSRSQRVER